MILVLLDAGANVMARDEYGITPLHRAVLHGDPRNIQTIFADGGDIMARTEGGNTPLHWAAKHGRVKNIQVLLDGGVDVLAKTDSGVTPPHWAADCSFCSSGIVQALLSAEADAKSEDNDGKRPWNFAKENLKIKGSDGY